MPHAVMLHEKSPKDAIWDKIGDISGIYIPFRHVLVAIYMRPEQTKSGIYMTDVTRDEDQWQGKVCMVLKVGHEAYMNLDTGQPGDFSVSPGEWVVIRPSDGEGCSVNSVKCRMIMDASVKMVIENPDLVY